MIEVTVTMHGNLRRFLPEGRASTTLRVPEGTTLRQVIEMVHAHDHVWLVAVNGTAASAAATVSAGDAVDLYEQLEGARPSSALLNHRSTAAGLPIAQTLDPDRATNSPVKLHDLHPSCPYREFHP